MMIMYAVQGHPRPYFIFLDCVVIIFPILSHLVAYQITDAVSAIVPLNSDVHWVFSFLNHRFRQCRKKSLMVPQNYT